MGVESEGDQGRDEASLILLIFRAVTAWSLCQLTLMMPSAVAPYQTQYTLHRCKQTTILIIITCIARKPQPSTNAPVRLTLLNKYPDNLHKCGTITTNTHKIHTHTIHARHCSDDTTISCQKQHTLYNLLRELAGDAQYKLTSKLKVCYYHYFISLACELTWHLVSEVVQYSLFPS